ncbi:MAG: hypothetical protein ACRYGG_13070 [Janthinobacterium lividum]
MMPEKARQRRAKGIRLPLPEKASRPKSPQRQPMPPSNVHRAGASKYRSRLNVLQTRKASRQALRGDPLPAPIRNPPTRPPSISRQAKLTVKQSLWRTP